MNRPGQAPQRTPSLAANPGLAGPFRGQFPSYGIPPRNPNVLQGGYVPGIQPNNQRPQPQTQSMVAQPSAGFIHSRGPSNFPFAGGLGQAQNQAQQVQSTSLLQHPTNPQQSLQQQQSNGTSASLLQHLQGPSIVNGTPSAPPNNEGGLDPKDFPALGSVPPAGNAHSSSNGAAQLANAATSYASQAGTVSGVGVGGAAASGAGTGGNVPPAQPRDFTADDFPALGGQAQSQNASAHPISQNQNQSQETHSHPPGLNGFQHSEHPQQHRQNLLGALGNGGTIPQGTPGMLNLGPAQARSIHPGFQQGQLDPEKQQQQRNNYAHKLNQATHAAWNSSSVNQTPTVGPNSNAFANQAPSATAPQQNGTHQTSGQAPPSAQPPRPPSQPPHLNAPPGVPQPASFGQQQPHQSLGPSSSAIANLPPAQYTANGLALADSHPSNAGLIPPPLQSQTPIRLPQTPAQQILMSAADRWGLLALLAMIKNAGTDADQGLSSIGTDLGTMGLDMGYSGNLYSTFITPWADQSAAHTVEPDFHLPACYSVHPPAPGPNKVAAFSDETLFFSFYSSPRDALQEVAAQELWNRNWRYHKDMRLWITKENGTSPSQKVPGGEQGTYTYWDPENWGKERKDMTVLYSDLEEKTVPVFAQGSGLVLASNATAVAGQVASQQQQPQSLAQIGQPQLSQILQPRTPFPLVA